MSVTPMVFCAVVATMAVVPYTPQRKKALRSAWMPAPAPESLVAMLITLFMVPPRHRRPGNVSLSLRQVLVGHRLVYVDWFREHAVRDGPVHVGAPFLRIL